MGFSQPLHSTFFLRNSDGLKIPKTESGSGSATPRYSGYSHGKGWNERPFKPQIGRNPAFCPKNFPDLKFLGFFLGPPPSQPMPEAPPGAGTGTSQLLLPKKKNPSPAFPGISQPSLFLKLRLFPTFSLKENEGFALFRQRQGEAAPKTSAQPQFWGIFQPIWEIREALWSPKSPSIHPKPRGHDSLLSSPLL